MVSADLKSQNSGNRYLEESKSPNQSLLPVTAAVNGQDHLEIGGCDVVELVQQFGSPLYILDEYTLRQACQQYRQAFQQYYPGESLVIFASKAWSNLAVCAVVNSEGLGFDVVSGGELYTALKAGVNGASIYFHGNNKSAAELQLAVEHGATVVVDNWLELKMLSELAAAVGGQPVKVMLRLTPGIECHTHEYIKTGSLDSKFGFDPQSIEALFQQVSSQPLLDCTGLHAHIGSQIFERQPHIDLGGVLVDWMRRATEYGIEIKELNIGGGLGIRYTESDDPPSIRAWAEAAATSVVQACQTYNLTLPKLIAEPGRSLIGSACITAYTIGSRKEIPGIRTYVAVDGGMSDNPRPITYQSVYRAVVANKMSAPATETVTVAGKHCESGDILIKDLELPATGAGDVLVVMDTGAYNYSMASNYNRLPRPAAVMVYQQQANLIIVRETYEDLIRQDRLPTRLA